MFGCDSPTRARDPVRAPSIWCEVPSANCPTLAVVPSTPTTRATPAAVPPAHVRWPPRCRALLEEEHRRWTEQVEGAVA